MLFGHQHTYAQLVNTRYSYEIELPKSEDLIAFTLVEDTIPGLLTTTGESLIFRSFKAPDIGLVVGTKSQNFGQFEHQKLYGDRLIIVQRSLDGNVFELRESLLMAQKSDQLRQANIEVKSFVSKPERETTFLDMSSSLDYVVFVQQEGYSKRTKAAAHITLLTPDSIATYTLPTNYDGDDLQLLGCGVDNNGTIYLAGLTGIKLNSPFRRKYMLFTFIPGTKELVEFDLSAKELFIREMIFQTFDNGLQIAALYHTDPLEKERSNGYIFVKLTSDGREIEQRFVSTFSIPMLQAHEGIEASSSAGISRLYLEPIMRLGEAPVIQVSKFWQDQLCTIDPRTGLLNCTDQFHFDGVSFIDVVGQSTILTAEKRQIDYDRIGPYSGHNSICLTNGSILVLYNDHWKNTRIKADKIMNNPARSSLRYVKTAVNGVVSSGIITDAKEAGTVFIGGYGCFEFNDKVYFLNLVNRSYRVGVADLSHL